MNNFDDTLPMGGRDANCAEDAQHEKRLRFTGSGPEYFRIWAVNLTLTVITLGLYSAWAKVRRLQYFYRHTELDDAAFDYVASPVAILLGRLLAVVLLVLYYLAFEFSANAGVTVTVLLAVVLPYLLWQSSRFKARNTQYRGLSFGFDGRLGEAYRVYLPPIMVVVAPSVAAAFLLDPKSRIWVLSLSLLGVLTLPFLHAVFRRYIQGNLRYGDTRFGFTATATTFMGVWLTGLGIVVVGSLGLAVLAFMVGIIVAALAHDGSYGFVAGIGQWVLTVWLSYLLIGSYFIARFQKVLWEKTSVGAVGFRCDISVTDLLKIQCMNALWVILTLGLYRPFAAIRAARYRLECMTVTGSEHLGEFQAGADQSRRGATGESAAEFFEMDVGL